jgi:predicted CXXCH cytochrome family protein
VKKISNTVIVAILILLSLIGSCAPRKDRKFLTFFFDGVPLADSVKPAAGTIVKTEPGIPDNFRAETVAVNSEYTVHYPYKEKDCFSCHDENSKSELIMPQPGLCYKCHDDFSKIYKKVHGPVAAGYCTTCHNAHMSKEKKLLIRTGQQLCLLCHESKAIMKNEAHKDIADSECTLCHNPHGGEDRFLLN